MPQNIILVDTSYTTFHRFFATLRWFSFAKKEIYKEHKDDNTYDWSKEPLFIEKYKKMYLDAIINVVSSNIYNNSIVIFCQDAPQETLWRNDLSTCYKGNRVDLSEKHNFRPTFEYTYNILVPTLVKHNKHIHAIKIANMEADDLIALATRYIRHKQPMNIVYIVSGDNDFLQLGYDNLYIADYKKDYMIHLTRTDAREALRIKIVTGDCSDNIPSIFPKDKSINNKRKKLIRENKDAMFQYLEENETARIQYEHNKKMISFRYIPKHFRKPVYSIVKQIITDN